MKTIYFFLFIIAFPSFLFAQDRDTTCICGKSTPKLNEPIIVETMAEYPGGKEALKELIQTNIKLNEKENGEIELIFLIGCKGVTCCIQMIKNEGISKQAEVQLIDILKKMKVWKPAKQRNISVDIPYYISLSITDGTIKFNRI